jgi:hypothetical protein
MRCSDCQNELAHCHELLIVHADGSAECTGDDACEVWTEAHLWVMTCAEAIPDGCCEVEMPIAA